MIVLAVVFTVSCWAIMLAVGRMLAGETFGPPVGAAMVLAWLIVMLGLHAPDDA